MPLTRKQREAARTWTFIVRLPADVPPHRAGRFVARILKRLGRAYGVKCLAIKDNPPVERVSS